MRSSGWVAIVCLALALVSLDRPVPLEAQNADAHQYVEAAASLVAGDGYVLEDGTRPWYPPGTSLFIVPFVKAGVDVNIVPTATTMALIALIWWSAWSLAGPVAAASAGIICVFSEMFSFLAIQVMSDGPAAAFVVAALLAITRGRPVLAGFLVGISAWFRLAHVLFAATTSIRRLAGTLAAVVPLAIVQLWVFGNLTGYPGDVEPDFALHWIWERPWLEAEGNPSAYFSFEYYVWLLFGRWNWMVVGLPFLAVPELWARREEPAARFGAWVIVANLLIYQPYYFQSARFIVPASAMTVIFASCGVAHVVEILQKGRSGAADDPQALPLRA